MDIKKYCILIFLFYKLRRHIKQLSISIVQEIRSKYSPMLDQHWNILMQIINLFLRDKHKAVVDFARTCCGYAISIF